MLPQIIISQDQERKNVYIQKVVNEYAINTHYIYRIKPAKTELGIDQIRELKKELITTSASHTRFFVLYEFDSATLEAQNALLKTLEEYSEFTLFLMLVRNKELVLPTIQSRSMVVDLDKGEQIPQVLAEVSAIWHMLREDKNYQFLTASSIVSISREKALEFFDQMLLLMRKELPMNPQISGAMKAALQKKSLLRSNNLNPQLAIDSFLLYLKRIL